MNECVHDWYELTPRRLFPYECRLCSAVSTAVPVADFLEMQKLLRSLFDALKADAMHTTTNEGCPVCCTLADVKKAMGWDD